MSRCIRGAGDCDGCGLCGVYGFTAAVCGVCGAEIHGPVAQQHGTLVCAACVRRAQGGRSPVFIRRDGA